MRTRLLPALMALVILVLAVIVLFPTGARAEGAEQVVRVGYYEQEVFEEGAAPDSVKQGYAYEYYRKIAEYTGWDYEYVYGDFNDLYQDLIDGKIDLLAGLAYLDERTGLIGYPDYSMGGEVYNLVKRGEDDDITSDPSSLAGRRIGVLDSALADALEAYLDKHRVAAEVMTYQTYELLYAAFDLGSVDVIATEGDGTYGREDLEVIAAFDTSSYYLCVAKSRPDLLEQLNIAQSDLLINEPSYRSMLRAKYYPYSMASRTFSADEKEWLSGHDTLLVGYLNHFLPYSDTDKDGNPTGLVRDALPAILESVGIDGVALDYQGFESYDDMVSAAAQGEIDVAFPVGGGPYYSEESGIYESRPLVVTMTDLVYRGTYSDETVARMAVNENNRLQHYYVKAHFPEAEIVFYPSIEACLDAVVSGEVGSTALGGLRAHEMLKNRRYGSLIHLRLSYDDARSFGVAIGDEGLLRLINRGINVLGNDYALNQVQLYTESLYTYSTLDFIEDHLATVIAAVVVVTGVIIGLLARDMHKTKRQRAELAEALSVAESANRAKTTFLNNMSHDIRMPMNAILGYTSLATTHLDRPDQVRDYLAKVAVSSKHLLSLINDVLDMSRIESGRVMIEESEVHLPELIHDIRTIIQSSVVAKRQELFINAQDVVHEDVVTDRLRLSQVLLNILTNAIKFTPEGGTITLRVIERTSANPSEASFEFRVKDTGIGMSRDFLETIFEPFTRAQTSAVSGVQGTGLGMAITKNIVDMMGGTITVTSAEGRGSEFVVNLQFRVAEGGPRLREFPELQGMRALVVDDDANTCITVGTMLHDIGLRVEWTDHGREAVVWAREASEQGDPFDVYIVDWMMPDQDGLATVRQIREAVGGGVPVIVLTAYDWAEIEGEAREAGVTTFWSKPFFMSELHAVLARSLGSEGDVGAGDAAAGAGSVGPAATIVTVADAAAVDLAVANAAATDPTATDPTAEKATGAVAGTAGVDGRGAATKVTGERPGAVAEGAVEADSRLVGRRVLLVEDDDINQQIAVAILESMGLEVEVAGDGRRAVELMEEHPSGRYDVVLMDVQMPVMDGYEATRRIRELEDDDKAETPIIAVTANAFEEDRQRSIEAGMDGYLAKPYDVSQIREVLEDYL